MAFRQLWRLRKRWTSMNKLLAPTRRSEVSDGALKSPWSFLPERRMATTLGWSKYRTWQKVNLALLLCHGVRPEKTLLLPVGPPVFGFPNCAFASRFKGLISQAKSLCKAGSSATRHDHMQRTYKMPCSIASVHRCRLGVLETCLRLSLRVILVILVIGDLPGESNESLAWRKKSSVLVQTILCRTLLQAVVGGLCGVIWLSIAFLVRAFHLRMHLGRGSLWKLAKATAVPCLRCSSRSWFMGFSKTRRKLCLFGTDFHELLEVRKWSLAALALSRRRKPIRTL